MAVFTFPRLLTARGWDINARLLAKDVKAAFSGKKFNIRCNADIVDIEFVGPLSVAEKSILDASVQGIDRLSNAKEAALISVDNALDDVIREEGLVNKFTAEIDVIKAATTLDRVDRALESALTAISSR